MDRGMSNSMWGSGSECTPVWPARGCQTSSVGEMGDFDLGPRPAFLLGAGFSKSISDRMPTMAELGARLVDAARQDTELLDLLTPSMRKTLEEGIVPYGDFETWLSLLATDPPYLSAHRRDVNRAVFGLLADRVADEVLKAQAEATEGVAPPGWLLSLISLWHELRAPVITLNYDLLVEACVRDPMSLWGLWQSSPHRVKPGDLTLQRPALALTDLVGGYGVQHEPTTTFKLLKLHGSLSWFRSIDDHRGDRAATVVRLDKHPPAWGQPAGHQIAAANDAMARASYDESRQRMIVPPQADKSAIFGHSFVSTVWRAAAGSLAEATSLGLIGCSLPKTDLAVRGLLSEHLPAEVPVYVFDRSPEAPVTEFQQLGFSATGHSWSSERTQLIDDLRTLASSQAVKSAEPSDIGYTVSNCRRDARKIADATRDPEGRCVIRPSDLAAPTTVPRPDDLIAPTARSLISEAIRADEPLWVLASSGENVPVIGIAGTGNANTPLQLVVDEAHFD